jgi:hypothetical protein
MRKIAEKGTDRPEMKSFLQGGFEMSINIHPGPVLQ